MEAEKLFERKFEVTTKAGKTIAFYMDLFRLPRGAGAEYPEGFKFSWIAFDPEIGSKKVLFDCHNKKGPHVHMDDDPEGEPFEWNDLDSAIELFISTAKEHFGDFELEA